MNAVYTHRIQTFMLTRRSLVNLIKNDPNQSYNNASGSEWGSVRDAMIDLGHFQELRKPKNGKAGVYKMIYKGAVEKLYELHDIHVDSNKSEVWFPHMEEKLIEYWDGKTEEKEVKYSLEDFEKWEGEQNGG